MGATAPIQRHLLMPLPLLLLVPLPLQRAQPFSTRGVERAQRLRPHAPATAAAPPAMGTLERDVAVFSSADPQERAVVPTQTLIALIAGTFISGDGAISLSLLDDTTSPIGSMVVKRVLLQQVGSASTMPNPPM